MGTFSIKEQNFEYEIQKGKILHVDEKLETVVSGGGGGFVANGQGRSTYSISSSTITHTTIFLENNDGKQFSIKLTNWKILCMTGNEMILIRLRNSKEDQYVLIYNKSLDSVYNGYVDNFISTYDKGKNKARLLIYAALLITIPLIAYKTSENPYHELLAINAVLEGKKYFDTKANLAGFIAFVIVLIGVLLFQSKITRKHNQERKYIQELKVKLNDLLNKNK